MNFIIVILLKVLILFSLNDAQAATSSQLLNVKPGQTLDSILSDLGFSARARGQIFSNPSFPKSHVLVPGAIFKFKQSGAIREVTVFDFPNDRQWTLRSQGDQGNLITKKGEWIVVEKRALGKIVGSLFTSLRSQVDSLKLAYRFQEVFLGEVNFAKLPSGTPFEMIYEELRLGSQFVGYGRMLYAKVEAGVSVSERYLVRSSYGNFYIDPGNAQSNRPFFAPVGEVKISSTFQPRRFHPVKKRWVAHEGIDYELDPQGPVRAAQKGVVSRIAYDRASGRHVILDHGGGWQSLYLHLHAFAPGLSVGDTVVAGELVGSVGCSGYCTRPHLHFALKHNGKFKDPLYITRSYSAPQAQLAKNHANMVSRRRLAAWRKGGEDQILERGAQEEF